jgi:endonuclease VIII
MPEGPEIRRATDAIAKVLRGKVVRKLAFGQPRLATSQKLFSDVVVREVESRGKAILTHFENGKTIYSHNQLYGEWAIFKPDAEPFSHKQRRIVIDTAAHRLVLYSASDIEVLDSGQVHRHPYIAKLGVELLNPSVTLADVLRFVNEIRWQKKLLAQLLLDQAFLAGVGNYLRSEILFVARLYPWVLLGDLDSVQKKHLAKAALSVTRQAYRHAGITNHLASAKTLKATGVPFSVYRHYVFDRVNQSCWVCQANVARDEVAGRQLHWCRRCQPEIDERRGRFKKL